MIAHDQTYFVGDGTGIPGNCMQAALASLLDLPLEEVPHFAALPEHGWWDAFLGWLSDHNLRITMFAERFDQIDTYRDGMLVSAPYEKAPSEPLLIAVGMSPRGVQHSVVWQNNGMVHDPHPSRAGFVDSPVEFWLLEAVGS